MYSQGAADKALLLRPLTARSNQAPNMTVLLQDLARATCEQPQAADESGNHRAIELTGSPHAWVAAMQSAAAPDEKSDDAPPSSTTDLSDSDAGGSHSAVRVLMTRSKLAQAMKEVPKFKNILIIEDNQRDSDRLASTLRTIFGYDANVRQCRTLGTALDEVMNDQPEIVFLDDRLGPIDKAEKSVPFLRTARYGAMIFVISSFIDRRRRADIMKLGVDDVIDKDDLDSNIDLPGAHQRAGPQAPPRGMTLRFSGRPQAQCAPPSR